MSSSSDGLPGPRSKPNSAEAKPQRVAKRDSADAANAKKDNGVKGRGGKSGLNQKVRQVDVKDEPITKSSPGGREKVTKSSPGKGANVKAEVKNEKAATATDGANVKSEDVKVKKEKPKYDLPGQTQPTPGEGEPLTKFYMSLLEQRPESEMAIKWCITRGLLSRERAEEWATKNGKTTTKKPPSTPKASQPRKSNATPARQSKSEKAQEVKKTTPTSRPKQSTAKKMNGQTTAKRQSKSNSTPAKKRQKVIESESEPDDEDSESEEILPASKRSRAEPSHGNNRATATRNKPLSGKKSKDVSEEDESSEDEAFDPDTDDSDELPLVNRLPKRRSSTRQT